MDEDELVTGDNDFFFRGKMMERRIGKGDEAAF